MRARKIAIAVASATTVSLALAGCSSSKSTGASSTPAAGASSTAASAPTSVSSTAAPASTPASAAATVAASSPATGGGLALTVEDYYTWSTGAIVDKVYKACAASIGDTITSTHTPGAGLIAKVLQQASSKTLPDVLMLDNPDVQEIAQSGALAPLTDYGISADGITPGVVSAGTYSGKLYGLAPAVNSLGLYYNTDMFTAAGITAAPKTWADFKTDAAKLTKPGVYGFAMAAIGTYEGTWQFMPWMWSNGGDEKNINTPQTAQALQFLTDLVKDGSMSKSVVTWGQDDAISQFTAGKAAMVEGGSWNISAFQAMKSLHWASVPLPTQDATQTPVAPLGGETYNVTETGNKDKMAAAAKIVACISSPANQRLLATTEGAIPSSVSIAAQVAQTNAAIAPFVAVVSKARSRTAELGPDWPTAATKIYTAEQSALTGKLSPTAALAQAQSQSQ